MMNVTDRLETAVGVVVRLGVHRAIEAGNPQIPPIPNPLGEGFTGVDLDGTTFRARIGVCDALSGSNKRITLGRSKCAEEAAFMYRAAHVALYGSYSWAADSLSDGERDLIARTRKAILLG